MCGQVAPENRPVWVCGQVALENRPLFFKMGRSPKIMRPLSFEKRSPWLSGSLNKPRRPFVFFTSLLCKTLRNFCFVSIVKRGHLLLPNFWPMFLINFQKKTKIAKKQWKPQKKAFLIYLHHFSIFNVISEEFKFSNVFWTRSTFNALILQSMIFCWVDVDIALFKK